MKFGLLEWSRVVMWKYLLVAFMLVSCKLAGLNTAVDSDLDNIYLEDGSASRRRKASDEELLKIVKLQGCTGHLMHPEYLMTAAHCKIKKSDKYSSGSAIVNRSTPKDITIEEIVENNTSLDFTIAKISWANGFPKDQKFTTLISTSQKDVSFSKTPEKGDEVIAIGYAVDKASEGVLPIQKAGSKNSAELTYYTTLPLLMVIQVVEFEEIQWYACISYKCWPTGY